MKGRFVASAIAAIAFAAIFALPAESQLFRRGRLDMCPGGVCPQPIYGNEFVIEAPPIEAEFEDGQEVSADQWYKVLVGPGRQPTAEEKAFAESVIGRAVRVRHGNGCGSGNLVGRNDEFIYILTNAHVASTRIGSTSSCEAVVDGKIQKFTATAIESAYSNTYRTDWTLLRAPASYMAGITPIQLSTSMPNPDALTVTWGCPRCEPIKGQACKTVRFGTVWYWQPNSIGGQSGSAVIQMEDGVPVQKGLLTWTESGNGSGQFSATIYKQSQDRTNRGEMRTGDENPAHAECVEGYHSGADPVAWQEPYCPPGVELSDGWQALGNLDEVAIRDYPIWHISGTPPPPPPPTEPPTNPPGKWDGWTVIFQSDTLALLQAPGAADTATTIEELREFSKLRSIARERGIDWIKLITIILQLIEMFGK